MIRVTTVMHTLAILRFVTYCLNYTWDQRWALVGWCRFLWTSCLSLVKSLIFPKTKLITQKIAEGNII